MVFEEITEVEEQELRASSRQRGIYKRVSADALSYMEDNELNAVRIPMKEDFEGKKPTSVASGFSQYFVKDPDVGNQLRVIAREDHVVLMKR